MKLKLNNLSLLLRILLIFLVLSCCGAPSGLRAQEFDRHIDQSVFVPKGQWLTGGSFSYGENTSDKYKFLILDNINGTNFTFRVSPYLAYFIKDNMCIGARFEYKRSMIKLDDLSLSLSDDLSFDVSDYYTLQHVYMGSVILRNYMALGKTRRFGLFNEVRLSAGGGQGKTISGAGENLSGTYQEIYELNLGIIPGLLAFITNEVAVEASVNIMGFSYKKYNQTTDQIYTGSLDHSSVNFKVDLFSINIGVSFYIPTLNPIRSKAKARMRRSARQEQV